MLLAHILIIALHSAAQQPPVPLPRGPQSRAAAMTLKELLPTIPPEDLVDFALGLRIQGGAVVSAYFTPLERTLDRQGIEKVNNFIADREAAPAIKKPRAPSKMVILSEALKGVPPKLLAEFCERITIERGRVVSLFTGGILKAKSKAEVGALLAELLPGGTRQKCRVISSKCVPAKGWICSSSACGGQP